VINLPREGLLFIAGGAAARSSWVKCLTQSRPKVASCAD